MARPLEKKTIIQPTSREIRENAKIFPYASINLETGDVIFAKKVTNVMKKGYYIFNPKTGELKAKLDGERDCSKLVSEIQI